MNGELKAQYEKDVESLNGTGKNAYRLYAKELGQGRIDVNVQATEPPNFEHYHYNRLPNADQIILDRQRTKYAEDEEWHPRPWELWEGRYKEDSYFIRLSNEPNDWKQFQCAIKFDGSIYYRRRPDAPTREQWEAERKEEKISILSRRIKKVDRCATCRHVYEPKPRTIHVSMQFPDGRTYVADLPEPMREAPGVGEVYHIVFNDASKSPITWTNIEKEKRWLKQGTIHRTKADAEKWLEFFKQWRSDGNH